MAEGVGFEPTVGLHPRRFSRPLHSSALPPLLGDIVSRRRSHAEAACGVDGSTVADPRMTAVWLLLGEVPPLVAILGGVLCIGGVIVARGRGQGPMRSTPLK